MEYRSTATQPIQEREALYRLMVGQLRYDGYENAAGAVGQIIATYPPVAPSSRLGHLVQLGMKTEGEVAGNPDLADMLPHLRGQGVLDLEYEADEKLTCPEISAYDLTYGTSHKASALTAAFSSDGRLAATGSADYSIKILDVERMMSKTAIGHNQDLHPVIRTLYDHTDAVLTLDFHPAVSVLVSGSKDCTIKFFDYSKPSVKKSYRTIQEVAPVRALSFHPSGDFLLAGTSQSTLRLYDINTLNCYVASDSRDQHTKGINSIHYSTDGRLYVTASEDGSIKVWDGVSNRCVNTFKKAHNGESVTSVRFSKNSKYVLSSGKDGNAALWELSTGRPLNTYQPSKSKNVLFSPCAIFNHTEDYVLMCEERKPQYMILSWDARTAQPHAPLPSNHGNTVHYISHSPQIAAFMTTGEDNRIKFFYHRDQ